MFKKYWFAKKIYPIFRNELMKVRQNSKSIFLWKNEDDFLKIVTILDQELIIILKNKNSPLSLIKVKLPQKIKFNEDCSLSYKEMEEYVLNMKVDGMIIDSQHIIEFVNNNLRNSVRYYNLSREDVSSIFKEIIIDNQIIFQNNPPATVMESLTNKWID